VERRPKASHPAPAKDGHTATIPTPVPQHPRAKEGKGSLHIPSFLRAWEGSGGHSHRLRQGWTADWRHPSEHSKPRMSRWLPAVCVGSVEQCGQCGRAAHIKGVQQTQGARRVAWGKARSG
jgi:hypothetical protein